MIQTRNQVLIIFTAAVIASLLYFYFDPSFNHYFPACFFHSLTGLYCPGCGSQRAFHQLLTGNIMKAADYNLLFMVFLPVMMYSAIITINNIFSSKKYKQYLFSSNLFAWSVFSVVMLFWILRNIPLHPLTWLAP